MVGDRGVGSLRGMRLVTWSMAEDEVYVCMYVCMLINVSSMDDSRFECPEQSRCEECVEW